MHDAEQMLRDIELQVRYTSHMIGKEALAPVVMAAMKKVPRAEFVPPGMRVFAYADGPLNIGHGQTISQPYMVALMTDLLDPKPDDAMLEIGTGSGYQAAVLSCLVRKVYSQEIIAELAKEAADRLQRLGYNNVEVRAGDGYYGWPEHAPFDGIIVTAATPTVPEALLQQLKPGGRLVIPVGQPYMHQELMVFEKDMQGVVDTRNVLSVAFVPLTGGHESINPNE